MGRGRPTPARNVERPPSGSDIGMLPLDPGDPGLIAAADWALAHGGYVVLDGLGVVLVSDVFVVEGVLANGLPPLPETARLVRADGRTLYAFQVAPGRWVA